ncbi:MAG: TonB-dependent receptor plug domain-containing protein, partial [Lacibacter sp.]
MKKVIQGMFFILLLFATNISWAQNKTVTGKVTGEKGEGVSKASVVVKNSTIGTTTNEKGDFTISVPSTAKTLVITSVGFESKEVAITNDPLEITLTEAVSKLTEVVVVGYGTQRVTKVSGAISTIKSAEIEKLRPVRVEEVLQGKASGVNVIQSGSPGSKPTVLIRGIPSFSGTDPVVIIDGVPQTLTDFNSINASDIESISVLKDAATTAIYGVKGGNGVIVVTTKSGRKNQKTEITISSN